MRRMTAIALAAVLLLALCLPAGASTRTIRVGYMDYDGYIVRDEHGQMQGYCVDYLEQVAQVAGWRLEYVYLTWAQALDQLERQEIDLLCSVSRSPEREEIFDFSAFPVATEQALLYTRPESDIYYDDFAAMDGARVAMLRGALAQPILDAYGKKNGIAFTTRECSDDAAMRAALMAGEVDAIIAVNLTPHDGLRPIASLASTPVYFAASRGSAVMDQLNEAVGVCKAEDPGFDAQLQLEYYRRQQADFLPLTRQEAQYIAKTGTVTVGLSAGRGPFVVQGRDGDLSGLYVELLELLSAQSGLRFVPELLELPKDQALVSGRYDLLIDLHGGTWPTATGFRRSAPFFDLQTAMVGRRGGADTWSVPLRLGIAEQYAGAAAGLQSRYPDATIHRYPDVSSCLEAVRSGQVDLMADSSYLLSYQLQNPRFKELDTVSTYYQQDRACFVAPASAPGELLHIVDKCLQQLRATELARLNTFYTNLNNNEISAGDMLFSIRYWLLLIGALCAVCVGLGLVIRRANLRARRIADDRRVAQLANETKSDFLSRMSHELRTPMNAIVGLTGLTLDRQDLPEEARASITQIDASSQYLLSLLGDILDMSRIENDKMELAHQVVGYEEFRAALYNIVAPQAASKGVHFSCTHNRPDCPYIYADKMRLIQIFVNLLNNAIKFTPAGGQVELVIDMPGRTEDTVHKRFTVRDTGCGMSEEFLRRMFRPFEQAQAENSAVGTGLGLAIVKNLVELMGGTISVSSQVGKGTHMVVDLHFTVAPAPSSGDGTQPSAPALAGTRVLVVEDHPVNQLVACKLLEKCGAAVDTANDGKQALARFLREPPGRYDYIFMDVRMPEMNGYDCTRAIRASGHPRAKTVPIIAMTANAFVSDIQMCHQVGMNAHVGKPVTIPAIEAALQEAANKSSGGFL